MHYTKPKACQRRNINVHSKYWTVLLFYFCALQIYLNTVTRAFELLPYVHIDYLHYSRLAQCQAKCAQMYGSLSTKRLNDGSERLFQNTSTEHYDICETGCIVHSRGNSRQTSNFPSENGNVFEETLFEALRQGQNFWWESVISQTNSEPNKIEPSTSTSIQIQTVNGIRVLCIQRQQTPTPTNAQSQSKNVDGLDEVRGRYGLGAIGAARRRSVSSALPRHQLMFDTYEAILNVQFAPIRPTAIKDGSKKRRSKNENEKSATDKTVDGEILPVEKLRFIVLWRQKSRILIGEIIERNSSRNKEKDNDEDTSWITAAIEPSNTFKVEGIQPGMLYRFMLVPIAASGRVGNPIKSDWIDIQMMLNIQKSQQNSAALSFFSHYSTHDHVGAVVRWVNFDEIFRTRLPPQHPQLLSGTYPTGIAAKNDGNYSTNEEKASPFANQFHQKPLLFEGCQLQIQYSNKTTTIVEVFSVDESDGFTLQNLGFASEYTVELKPLDSSSLEYNNNNNKMVSINSSPSNDFSASGRNVLRGSFRSMTCSQIYGAGSLECDPEPVQNVNIIKHIANGTITVEWLPVAETHYTLLYQLYYLPVSKSSDCALQSTSVFLTANTTQAQLSMPTITKCEFELRLINYDLLGRDATAHRRFFFGPPPSADKSSSSETWLRYDGAAIGQQILRHLPIILLIAVAVAVLFLAVILAVMTRRRKATPRRRACFWRWKRIASSASSNSDEKNLSTNTIVEV